MSKRMFEILDEMNQVDAKEGTSNVAISNIFIGADKVKAGARITMGAEERYITEIATGKVIPLLIMVNKEEYDKCHK